MTDQPSLFDRALGALVSRREASKSDVLEQRDRAMTQVAQHAEEHRPGFGELARAFVLEYLREHGPTSGEQLTDACIEAVGQPHDLRAFGPVYHRLARTGQIVKVGACSRRRGRGTSGGNIWAIAE